ncbi:MAG: cytochrome-c peroxidase [Saprospiraceae bacterium]
MTNSLKYYLFFLGFFFLLACNSDDEIAKGGDSSNEDNDLIELTDIAYNPQPYNLIVPKGFSEMEIPVDNPLTIDGVNLGRHLFYDPILSGDSTMSCSTCHLPEMSFTDGKPVSEGIDGLTGKRSSMSLLNVGFYYTGLFWDGRSTTLEEQALLPVEDPIELHNTWPNIIDKLKVHSTYPVMFRKAFGIEGINDISKEMAAKAIAQFERIMVSSGESRYDIVNRPTPGEFFTEQESDGEKLFFDETDNHPGCSHCHKGALITTNEYKNNGFQPAADYEDYEDKGRGLVTGNLSDNGKFRVPTLRNIEHSAPYMHNGSFNTLEEVIDHYAVGGFQAIGTDTDIKPFTLTIEEKDALIAYIKTFSDEGFMNNPDLANPFE